MSSFSANRLVIQAALHLVYSFLHIPPSVHWSITDQHSMAESVTVSCVACHWSADSICHYEPTALTWISIWVSLPRLILHRDSLEDKSGNLHKELNSNANFVCLMKTAFTDGIWAYLNSYLSTKPIVLRFFILLLGKTPFFLVGKCFLLGTKFRLSRTKPQVRTKFIVI